MTLFQFPDPTTADEDGLLALGGNLELESLLLAYSQGIFPWPIQGLPLAWFCPPERAVLDWNQLHISKSLKRFRNKKLFHFSIDQKFDEVIQFCAKIPRPRQKGTWITKSIYNAYRNLHQNGHAHSIEVWEGDQLIGGLYGVESHGSFSAESMFHLKPNASKLAILFLMDYLHSKGQNILDIQVMTPHMENLGAKHIPCAVFLKHLAETKERKIKLF